MSIMTKRYALFAGAGYYPRQAWADYVGSFDEVSEAVNFDLLTRDEERTWPAKSYMDWAQVVDLLNAKVVKWGNYDRAATAMEWADKPW